MAHFVGVDVGTGSARAGVFDAQGRLLGSAKRDVSVFRDAGGIAEQSSGQVWGAVCASVKEAMVKAAVPPAAVRGIGFDATCSLVVLGPDGASLPVGPSEDPARDIVLWMDHRAVEQAARINATGHAVLRYVGGAISPEMETPKLLWLKENRRAVFDAAWQFFDLTDFLTWKATGSLARSICTVTCKWTYLAHEARWDESYFRTVGLEALADEGFARIGTEVVAPGTPLAGGLTDRAAAELGLEPGTPVGAGLIDAHAGGIGTVGATGAPTECLGYVFGTSSCTMTTTTEPVFVPGVWGPYYSAMVPGSLAERRWAVGGGGGDRSPAEPASRGPRREVVGRGRRDAVSRLARARRSGARVAAVRRREIGAGRARGARVPRQPRAVRRSARPGGHRRPRHGDRHRQPRSGSTSPGSAASATGCGRSSRPRPSHGAPIERIMISGGAGQLDLVRQLLADATGKPVVATGSEEPVLLGSAILGAVAGGAFPDVRSAMAAMSEPKATFEPTDGRNQGLARMAIRRVPTAPDGGARDQARATAGLTDGAARDHARASRETADRQIAGGERPCRQNSISCAR